MSSEQPDVVVAGHICLDIIPTFDDRQTDLAALLVPGKLVDVGPAVVSTGGAVSNTGLALHRLGVPTALMGKIGDDLFGRAVLDVIRSVDPSLTSGMIIADDVSTSYTIVISPPGVDRIFLHCGSANDTFAADDVSAEAVSGAKVFHLGYPPLLRRMHADGGDELASLLQRVKAAGRTVSLDLARPDPDSPAGKVDWASLLAKALPHVDVLCPGLDEVLFMLDRPRFDALVAAGGADALADQADGELLAEMAGRLLSMGPGIVMLKLGDQGAYLRTTDDAARLAGMGPAAPGDAAAWAGRELFSPCFEVSAVGATGAGDCAIASFLAALLRGDGPEDALTAAVAVGACNVERPDALSGVPTWAEVEQRIAAGWQRRETGIALSGWTKKGDLLVGPKDGED